MKKETFLVCNKCKAHFLMTTQENGTIAPGDPAEQMKFMHEHISKCRQGQMPTADDKAFDVVTHNA